jgi:hypothetical protein
LLAILTYRLFTSGDPYAMGVSVLVRSAVQDRKDRPETLNSRLSYTIDVEGGGTRWSEIGGSLNIIL